MIDVTARREAEVAITSARDAALESARLEERIPREHEPRNSHADERHHRHDRPAARHRARAEAARLYADHRLQRRRAADHHQRHPRLLENRGRHARRSRRSISSSTRWSRAPWSCSRSARSTRRSSSPRSCRRTCRSRCAAIPAGSARCSRTSSATRSSSPRTARSSSRALRQEETEDEVVVRFTVRDTGIGISPEAQAQALRRPSCRRTARPRAATAAPASGLAICKQLVQQMGGAISVTSEPGKGSTFCVHRAVSANSPRTSCGAPACGRSSTACASSRSTTTLANRRILQHLFAAWGMTVSVAAERPRSARSDPPRRRRRAALRPRGARHGRCRRWTGSRSPAPSSPTRSSRRSRLVMLTSLDRKEPPEALRDAGIEAHLTKPLKQEQLVHHALPGHLNEPRGAADDLRPHDVQGRRPAGGRRRIAAHPDRRGQRREPEGRAASAPEARLSRERGGQRPPRAGGAPPHAVRHRLHGLPDAGARRLRRDARAAPARRDRAPHVDHRHDRELARGRPRKVPRRRAWTIT